MEVRSVINKLPKGHIATDDNYSNTLAGRWYEYVRKNMQGSLDGFAKKHGNTYYLEMMKRISSSCN